MALTVFTSGISQYLDNPDQWAPTLTAHDPNPPIPLESAAVVVVSNTSNYFLAL